MYKIIGGDGKEYGPVSLDQLKSWLAQRRISAQTRVLAPGSDQWRPVAEVPELAALLGPAAPCASDPAAPPLLKPLAEPSKKTGLAVLSFVLGLCSFVLCLSILAGLPAIIIAHIARRRAVRLPESYGGLGFARAGLILGYLNIVLSFVVFSLLLQGPLRPRPGLPPLSDCQNNLRQIGLAFKVWALEHNDQYPFNVSTNAGGSLEFCARGADGFEKDSVPHFQIIANDLSTPSFLVCPQDHSKSPAPDFSSLRAANVSYLLRTGTNINGDNPQEVLAVCPIHGNVLYCDGNVRKKPKK